MKRLLLIIAIAFIGFAATGQDSIYVPDYGIDIMSYEVEQRMPNDTTVMQHIVRFNSKRELGDEVVFYYDVKSINMEDSTVVSHIKQLEVVLGKEELNSTLQGKKVYEWLEQMMTPQDSAIQKALAEIAYKFKVLGGN